MGEGVVGVSLRSDIDTSDTVHFSDIDMSDTVRRCGDASDDGADLPEMTLLIGDGARSTAATSVSAAAVSSMGGTVASTSIETGALTSLEATAVSPAEISRSPMGGMESTFFVDLLKCFNELRTPLMMLTFLEKNGSFVRFERLRLLRLLRPPSDFEADLDRLVEVELLCKRILFHVHDSTTTPRRNDSTTK